MLSELRDRQREYANTFLDSLDIAEAQAVVDTLHNCSGLLFFTGVGKSGLVAKKIVATMISTGTKAMYLSPMDALHGDLGMVSSRDAFVILSKSGESDELLNLIPAIRSKGATLIGIVCNSKSRLAAACHHSITLRVERELCPFDMAPTMSTTAQLMFGDLMAVALMQRKNFGLDQFALNHPSGRIGKRMTLKVCDLMLTGDKIPLCSKNMSLMDALPELSNKRCGSILVVDDKRRLLGIFTDGDLRRAMQKEREGIFSQTIEQHMNAHPRTIAPHLLAWEAMQIMEANPEKRITVLPVVDETSIVVGLLHLHDIVQSGL